MGTRPEAIKMAPVLEELRRHADRFESILVSTGQHRELLDQAFDAFGLTPDIELGLMEPSQTLSGYAAKALSSLSEVMLETRPNAVLVQGDTTTVAMAALAAFYSGIFVGHVEAGLRSFDRTNPFPEEMNRELAGLVANLHFVPTERARANLLRTGIAPESVLNTGNTIVDALRSMTRKKAAFEDPEIHRIVSTPGRLIVVTVHRRESFGEPLREICRALRAIVTAAQNVKVVIPVHPNPAVEDVVHEELAGCDRIYVIPAVTYGDMVRLMQAAYLVLSDSGGVQEEAPSLNVPLLVLRNLTERPEAVESGAARLVGTSKAPIVEEVKRLLGDPVAYEAMRGAPNPYGDGHAAERIVRALGLRVHAFPKGEDASDGSPRSFGGALRSLLLALAVAGAPPEAAAQSPEGFVEVGGASHRMTAGLGSISQVFTRAVLRTDPRNVWHAEAVGERKFDDEGVFFGLSNTHTFNDRWYASASVGASAGAFFFPRYRAGVMVARKWPAVPGLVTTGGVGYNAWKDGHRDVQLTTGAMYYFRVPLVVEGGITWNRSSPGNVVSRYQFLALTQGRDRHRYLTARIAGGREAYQLIGPDAPIANFRSSSVQLGVRQWVTRRWGLAVAIERYTNPAYTRRGATFSAFYQLE